MTDTEKDDAAAPADNARHTEKMKKKKAVRDKMVEAKTIEKGLLIVHTGKGKGKSSSAFGMVFRALGHGMKVGIVQFIKGAWETGEAKALERFGDDVSVNIMGQGFTWETQDREADITAARAAWEVAKELIMDDIMIWFCSTNSTSCCATIICPSRKWSPCSSRGPR